MTCDHFLPGVETPGYGIGRDYGTHSPILGRDVKTRPLAETNLGLGQVVGRRDLPVFRFGAAPKKSLTNTCLAEESEHAIRHYSLCPTVTPWPLIQAVF